jgi:hypothetical protein
VPRAADSIFVSVASYCDPLLDFTLRSAWSQASRPSRVFFGVVEQAQPGGHLRLGAQWAQGHVRRARLEAVDARGPCWARAIAMGLYQGEDWYLQIDSHSWFEPGWDDRLVDAGRHCMRTNPRAILSCYPNPFHLVDGHPRAEVVTRGVLAHVLSDGSAFAPDHPILRFEAVPVAGAEPVPAIHVAAGCLFAPGRVVDELPYDPALYFHGEEQSFALRAWTRGWDLWHVPAMPLYHLYTRPDAPRRPLHWTADQVAQPFAPAARLDAAARARLRALLWDGADLGAYGLGRARSLAEYAGFSGIDYAARTIAPRATKARFGY